MPVYQESLVLPIGRDQLFDLVADIESYPRFMPWVRTAKIREKGDSTFVVDQEIRAYGLGAKFTSKAVLDRPARIDITGEDGPFKHFSIRWSFAPVAGGGCRVSFHLDCEMRSRVLDLILGAAVWDIGRRTVRAFARRASERPAAASR